MHEINDILGKPRLMREDLYKLLFLATQGDAEEADARMMMVDRAVWQIVTAPDYDGDITETDLAKL